MALNGRYCFDTIKQIEIDFDGNTPTLNSVWNSGNFSNDARYCVVVTDPVNDTPGADIYLLSSYTNCYECLTQNYGVVFINDCFDDGFFAVTMTSFSSLPQEKDVFSATIEYENGKSLTSCYQVSSIVQFETQEEYLNGINTSKIGIISPQVSSFYTDCIDCITGATLPYIVKRCTDDSLDCVLLANGPNLINHIISYTNGVDNYCGRIESSSPSCTTYFSFIQDYGREDIACNNCLSESAIKIKLQNCLNESDEQVVWGSALFGIGESSSLSTDLGCYTVLGETQDPVTINYYLNFDPQPTCQDCFECNGITIYWSSCTNPSLTGVSTSYKFVSIGDFIYHPQFGCLEITNVQNGDNGNDYLYSFPIFTSCLDCSNSLEPGNYTFWNASACTSGVDFTFQVVINNAVLPTPGDVYKLTWGDTPFICVVLIEECIECELFNEYYYSNTPTTCENCVNDYIGVRAINCETNVNSLFNLTQEDYIKHHFLKDYYTFQTELGCYFIPNSCPQIPTGTTAVITNYYIVCSECNQTPPPPPPVSAGTEYFVCQICEGESGYTATQVTVPHPIWSRADGREVIQMSAVQLGGMFGLNS